VRNVLVATTAVALLAGWTYNSRPPVVVVDHTVYTGYHVPSSSMEPTLHCARPAIGCGAPHPDRVVVRPLRAGEPRRGDIVAFHTPSLAATRCGAGGVFLKRVIGLPGEQVSERDGIVFVDGTRLHEPYVGPGRRDNEPAHTWARLGAGRYFLLGDNRAHSCDSRIWGSVERNAIIGVITKIYRQR
jgi:signal peptidase I